MKVTRKLHNELRRSFANKKYEPVGDGRILVAGSNLIIGGAFDISVNGDAPTLAENTFTTEGLNYLLDVAFGGATQSTPWYVALFSGPATPAIGWTAASWATEFQGYSESVRQTYTETTAASGSINNTAAKATFTINASGTLYGGALMSSSVKGGSAGKLAAAGLFAATRAVVSTDSVALGYTLTIAAA
jgi:hypothetical protein